MILHTVPGIAVHVDGMGMILPHPKTLTGMKCAVFVIAAVPLKLTDAQGDGAMIYYSAIPGVCG